MTKIELQLLINDIQINGVTPAKTAIIILKGIYNLAIEEGLIIPNRAEQLRVKNVKKKHREAISKHDQKILLKYSTEQTRDTIVLLLNTGLRVSELMGLTLDEVLLKDRMLYIKHQLSDYVDDESGLYVLKSTKTGNERYVPLNKEAYKIIKKLYNHRKEQLNNPSIIEEYKNFIFLNKYFKPIDRLNVYDKIRYVTKKAYDYGEDFDTEIISPHVFRHTFASRCLEAGMAPTSVSKLMGHTTVRMTTNYIHSTKDGFREDVAFIDKI